MQVSYLCVANVMRGSFDLSEIKAVGTAEGDDAHRLFKGDVLIVEGHADVAQIGRAAVWAGEVPNMFHQNHLIRARCGEGLAPQFLCLLINSPHGQTYFRSHAKSSSGLNTINSTVVKDYVVPAPPIEVQME
jgi:restriction endonuclease S subunit